MKLAIFDMDGTTLDTLEDLYTTMIYVLRKNHLPDRTKEEVRSFVGNGIYRLVELAAPPVCQKPMIDIMFDDFCDYYKDHCADTTRPYEGVIELIQNLRAMGIKTAIVSNKSDFAVQSLCNQYFPGLFDIAIGSKENVRKKPAPDSIYAVCGELGISVKDSIYIGDSEVDIETARNANMDVILVDWGFRDRSFLKEKGAETIVSTPREVFNFITK